MNPLRCFVFALLASLVAAAVSAPVPGPPPMDPNSSRSTSFRTQANDEIDKGDRNCITGDRFNVPQLNF